MPRNHLIHGDSHTRLYHIWKSMRERCRVKSHTSYERYGARGIEVCSEWEDYQTFKKWALDNGYNETLTIDRIDVNGDYEPANCRWATYKEQANNTRKNRILTAFGKTMTMTQWSEITGIKVATIWARLHKGWSIEDALSKAVK